LNIKQPVINVMEYNGYSIDPTTGRKSKDGFFCSS